MKGPGFVYLIHNADMSRFYVGSTNNTKVRFKQHKYELGRGKHHSQALQRAWSKYGGGSFNFTVILKTATRMAASVFEDQVLSFYYKERGCLNVSSSGLMSAQCPHVVAMRNAILKTDKYRASASLIQKSWRAANPEKAKANDLKSAKTRGSQECRKANSERGKARSSTDEAKAKFKESVKDWPGKNKKSVIRTEPDGSESEFKSISEAGRVFGIHINGISMCCLGKRKTADNAKWRFVGGGANAAS